jgi:uncharacterized protein
MRKKVLIITVSIIVTGLIVWGINYLTHSIFNIKKAIISQKIKTYNSNKCGVIIPNPYGYTNDFVTLFSKEEIVQLDSIIEEHEKQTTNQLTIITVDTSMLGKCSLNDYATEVGNQWGVGQKEKNNGCVVAISPSQHQIFISSGYGIEKQISNVDTKHIVDSNMLPYYKQLKYFEGTKFGILALTKKLLSPTK